MELMHVELSAEDVAGASKWFSVKGQHVETTVFLGESATCTSGSHGNSVYDFFPAFALLQV